jgi:hypothetical protein
MDRSSQEVNNEWEDSDTPDLIPVEECHESIINVAITFGGRIIRVGHCDIAGCGKRNGVRLQFNPVQDARLVGRGMESGVPSQIADEVIGEVKSKLANIAPLTWVGRTTKGEVEGDEE